MRRNHLNAVVSQLLVQRIAVIGAIADQILRLGFDHVEVEAELHQADFVMVRCVRADRERQPWRSTIAMIFMPFPRFVGPISDPPPLAITNVASMKHSSSSSAPLSRSSLATSVKTRRKISWQHQV